MSDDTNVTDEDAQANEPNIKKLREAAEQGAKDRAENERMKRELAFAKAGIDTDSKLGGMLAKTYEGDLTDVEALRAEWAELSPTATSNTETPEVIDTPTPPGFQNAADQQQHREQVTATGQPAGAEAPETKHPVDLAFERFHADKQKPIDDRREGALSTIFEAYFNGDERVMFDKAGFRQQALQASAGDGAQ